MNNRPLLRRWGALLATCALLAGTGSLLAEARKAPTPAAAPPRFAIMSDLHYDAKQLGTGGAAFDAYLAQDPKMLVESEAILDSALQDIVAQNVKFVLVPGDMTKDGEIINHVRVAQRFAWLEQHGIQVYVVPGNHDINNPDAVAYTGDTTRPVPSASPAVFRALYQRFGYGQAIARDKASLSYVAEPAPGLWLLAIDSCKYEESLSQPHPVVSGRIKPETMAWALEQLRAAKAQNKQVIAMMHHGVNLHFPGQDVLFPDYLVDDWQNVSTTLADAGLKVIFTGHYHSQDASYLLDAAGTRVSTLCDVQTGSLTMFPCAFRLATLDSGMLHIESRRVTEIDADTGGVPFQQYAYEFLNARVPAIAAYELQSMFPISEAEAAALAPFVADAIIANYAGDEAIPDQLRDLFLGWAGQAEPMHTLGMMLLGIWTDLPPGDNELTVPVGN